MLRTLVSPLIKRGWLPAAFCVAALALSVGAQRKPQEAPGGEVQAAFATPAAVWKHFDPRREPLDVTLKRIWQEKGIAYREFYFTGETFEGEPVRVYALFGTPVGAKRLPAVLHIHGGGQTASVRWLEFWARRGYAAMTFDFCGTSAGRVEVTYWGKLKQGNMNEARAGVVVHPDQHASSWYHWALICRRCLTYLERQPEVDPKRMGIFGVSVGGTLVWPVAAFDTRVKAACAIYGNGWETYPHNPYAPDLQAADSDTRLWRATMQAESYAPFIRCPVLFLSATNDHHGKMDRAYDTLARMTAPNRLVFTPRNRHHIEPAEGRDLPLWLDTWLRSAPAWPKTPAAALSLDTDGIPMLTLRPDRAQEVERVEFFYAVSNTNPMSRYWRNATGQARKRVWIASLPILDTHQRLFAFANVHYRSGVCLSSFLATAIPAELGAARATDTPSLRIDDGATGYDSWVWVPNYTDPVDDFTLLRLETGPGGQEAFSFDQTRVGGTFYAGTHRIGDPKWRGPKGAKLQFQVLATEANTLDVVLIEKDFMPGMATYHARIPLKGSAAWQTLHLSPEQFVSEEGKPLAGWDLLEKMELRGNGWTGALPVFSLFRWEP